MRRKANLEHVKTVRVKGRDYHYFNTGQKIDGKPVYTTLPDKKDPDFGVAYATALGQRNKRRNVKTLMTMRELAHRYQLSPRFTNRAEGTKRAYLIYIRVIIEAMGDAPIEGVERVDVRKLVDSKGAKTGAALTLLTVFRTMIAFAQSKDWLTRDVSDGMEIEHDIEPYQPWPEDLLTAALADPAIQLPVALLYYTDQRIGDVSNMRWANIRDGAIEIVQQKTGKEISIPVHSALDAILSRQTKGLTTILCDANGKPRSSASVRWQIKQWLRSQGQGELTCHGLRKNGVQALLEAGCSVAEVCSISGHSLAMVEHYARGMNKRKVSRSAMGKWEQNTK